MADTRSFLKINLLPKDSFEFSALGKLLSWAMTSGRVMVVLTEFVVLLSFGSRFYFDKKLNDLTEVIDQKIAQIDAYADVETQARTLLAKQVPVAEFLNRNIKFSQKYDDLSKSISPGVKLEKIYFDQNTMKISGKSDTELGFAQFLRNLKLLNTLSYMNIKDTTFDQTSKSVSFTIQANFK